MLQLEKVSSKQSKGYMAHIYIERERKEHREIYVYIYICVVKLLTGPSLGVFNGY